MSIELIYIIIGAFLLLVFIWAISLFQKRAVSRLSFKKINYNFYLLRNQYHELLDRAKALIAKSSEKKNFKAKIKILNSAVKTVERGLNFFPDNPEGKKLLDLISEKKTSCAQDKIGELQVELKESIEKNLYKKYPIQVYKVLLEVKKCQALMPKSPHFKEFRSEVEKELVRSRGVCLIKEGNRAAFRHKYKSAIKYYSGALINIQELRKKDEALANSTEKKVRRILSRIEKGSAEVIEIDSMKKAS